MTNELKEQLRQQLCQIADQQQQIIESWTEANDKESRVKMTALTNQSHTISELYRRLP